MPLLAALLLAACGQDESSQRHSSGPRQPITPPRTVDGLTPAERARFCFLKLDLEPDSARDAILEEIRGTWTHRPVDRSASYKRKEFRLDLNNGIAAVTEYHGIGKDVEDITFRKVCVSRELDAKYGPFEGYRFIEFMARNNSGGAALLFRRDASALTISDSHYVRYANDKLDDPESAVRGSMAKTVWIYRERK